MVAPSKLDFETNLVSNKKSSGRNSLASMRSKSLDIQTPIGALLFDNNIEKQNFTHQKPILGKRRFWEGNDELLNYEIRQS